jgi:hypothetical protein
MGFLLIIVFLVAQSYAVWYDLTVQNIGASWWPIQVVFILATIILAIHRANGDNGSHSGARRTPSGMAALCLFLFQLFLYGGMAGYDAIAASGGAGLLEFSLIVGGMAFVFFLAGIIQTINALAFHGEGAEWDAYTEKSQAEWGQKIAKLDPMLPGADPKFGGHQREYERLRNG